MSEQRARLWHASLRLWIWKNHPHLRVRWWEKHSVFKSKYLSWEHLQATTLAGTTE